MSQGGVQTVLRLNPEELDEDIKRFKQVVDDFFQERTLQVLFSYRMRLGVRKTSIDVPPQETDRIKRKFSCDYRII